MDTSGNKLMKRVATFVEEILTAYFSGHLAWLRILNTLKVQLISPQTYRNYSKNSPKMKYGSVSKVTTLVLLRC